MRSVVQFICLAIIISIFLITGGGCANIIPPGGGPKDSLPPKLVSATPPDSSKNVNPTKVTLTFNEYINPLQNSENIIISPTTDKIPTIESHLRTITVKFKEPLESNTTYSINFGNTIKDVNEGNVMNDFTYVFSTGNSIDENTITGKVVLAETGGFDSTLIVVLHSNIADSAILKLRPRYFTKLDGSGNFTFNHLPSKNFKVYVVAKESYLKQYDSTRQFAFLDSSVRSSLDPKPVTLYAYTEVKLKPTASTSTTSTSKSTDKRLRYTNLEGDPKDIFTPLQLEFNKKIKTFDSNKIILSDTNYNRLTNYSATLDSNATKLRINFSWKLGSAYKLIITKDAITDVEGVTLTKNDTITILTKKAEDYGQIKLRFPNIDLSKNPVLQIVQNNNIIQSIPLTTKEWKNDLYKPGEYDLRLLYDQNKNGIWDPGNFQLKKQPEIVVPIKQKMNVKRNWESQIDITL